MVSGYHIYKVRSGKLPLMQLAKYTIHNHCFFSLSATRVTTVVKNLFLQCSFYRGKDTFESL